MTASRRRLQCAELIRNHLSILDCPLCGSSVSLSGSQSLICQHRHTFDLNRKGYVNLLAHPVHTDYDRSLFKARRKIIAEAGFFDPLFAKIAGLIGEAFGNRQERPLLLADMGCGEGSPLSLINERLLCAGFDVCGIGLDLSRDGIELAAARDAQSLWLVADLARPPLAKGSVDVLLNILSPSNYQIFRRLLKKNGLLIKVVPQSGYLQEMRHFFYHGKKPENYSPDAVISRLQTWCEQTKMIPVHYVKTVDPQAMRELLRMTPLTWHADPAMRDQWLAGNPTRITVDLAVLVGRLKMTE